MNQHLKNIQDLLQQNNKLSEADKEALLKAINDADKQWSITDFKLDRTEKVKKTTAILLEETIEELEQKRKAVEAQNRELEIESSLERVRTVAMSMMKSDALMSVCEILLTELQLLGFKDTRLAQIFIFNDAKESCLNYQFSDYGVKGITEINYNSHPVIKKLTGEMRKAKEAFMKVELSGNELEEWKNWRKEVGQLTDPKLDEADSIFYYWYSIGAGAIGISTFKGIAEEQMKILDRFRNVFSLAYKRYTDIAQAEAQARESQIQLALERVRARTMAMQKSDELSETSALLFAQIRDLGIETWTSGFNIWQEDETACIGYNATPAGEIGVPIRLPLTEDVFFKTIYDAKKRGEDFIVFESEGASLAETYRYMLTLPVVKDVMQGIVDAGFELPKYQVTHCVFFPQGHLMFITLKPQPEAWDIFKRFGKVFEQTYTRFLDLQKAEAQARESQIEASLERVRASAMAMHHSDELSDVLTVLFEQFDVLNIRPVDVHLDLFDLEKNTFSYRATGKEGKRVIAEQIVEIDSRPEWQSLLERWKKGKPNTVGFSYYPKEVIPVLMTFFPDIWAAMPEDSIMSPEDFPDGIYDTLGYCKFGYIGFHHYRQATEEEKNILIRFANEFERLYQRFLDLQKAEAQARESQIQLALERVRARTMAMQKSDELAETAALLFKQINDLGIQTWTSGFNIWEKDDRSFIGYNPTPSGGITPPYHIPSKEDSFFINIYEAKKRGEDFFVFESAGESLRETYTYMKTLPVVKEVLKGIEDSGIQLPTFQINHCTFFSHGFLLFITLETYLEAHDIFKRFGKVFEQTYTRFLDLKKAEAQAREAKIEAALEKVRSRTMAMQKSEDLNKAASDMFKQIQLLGMHPWACGFNIFDKDEKAVTQYMSLADGGISPPFRTPLTEDPFFISIYEARQRREDLLVMESSGKELEETYRYMLGLPGSKEIFGDLENSGFAMPKFQITHCAYFSQGYLVFITYEHVTEAHDIFKRFAKVFEQTYTRFLDLQKAEAQAREAMIETALERVRSRSMAMHHSNDLQDVIRVLSDQLLALGLKFDTASFAKVHNDGSWDLWISTPDQPYPAQVFVPYFDHPIFREVKEEDDKKVHFYARSYSLEEKNSFFKYFFENTAAKNIPEARKQYVLNSKGFARSVFFLKNIWLSVANYEGILFSKEENAMLQRFANVFEQTYTRFLDLQKAEAQARESQIELGLERVRARAMAMQKSDELSELVDTVFKELTKLDFALNWCIINIIHEELLTNTVWAANPDIHKPPESYYMKFEDYPFHHAMMKGYKERSTKYVYVLEGQEKKIYDEYLFNETEFRRVPAAAQTASRAMEKYVVTFSFSNFGGLQTVGDAPLSDANIDILSRFGKVFDLTYTRFNDLQKAEAQAREAQIEAALERVRSRSMGMQKSEELKEVIQVVYEQFVHLNIHVEHTGFIMDYKTRDDMHIWLADKHVVPFQVTIPYFDCAHWNSFNEAKKKGLDFFANHLSFEEKNKFYQDLFKLIPGVPEETLEYYFSCPGLAISTVLLENVGLYIENFSGIPYTDEENNTLMRFGKVFQQTYTRFLDLQKAEAQAREAKIEAALEKIRSRSLGMHHSVEIKDVVSILFEKLKELNLAFDGGAAIHLFTEGSKNAVIWVASPLAEPSCVNLPYDENAFENNPIILDVWHAKETGDHIYNKFYSFEEKNRYFDYVFKHNDFIAVPKSVREFIPQADSYTASFIAEKNSLLGANSWTRQLFSDDDFEVLKRVARVFEQAYIRFLDLQKAEAQTREAQIETALEKVRSRTLAMQKSDELAETAAVLFQQLILLGIEPNRLYINIIKNETGEAEFWITDEDGSKVSSAFESNMNDNQSFKKMYKGWKEKKKSLMIDMKGKELEEYFEHLSSIHVPFKDGLTQKRRLQYIAYFNKGFIGMASPDEQPEETMLLLERFAAVFNLTFTRFNDLKIAEAHAIQAEEDLIKLQTEKKRAEDALTELQVTQKQLIQSEKMASLGELTAGIAHEIQNPLNFVNNFSDVSNELLEEMKTELEKGNTEDAMAIVDDVKQNLEKILHHGKRADAIVKGMLQHSRSSSGVKEPTDINTLADEYLRLTYHGLRAKDKSFNATIKTDFEENIGNINIIPQDIGRVLLNLYTNAFYAVGEKKKLQLDGYEPIVSVRTKKSNGKVEISVKDNGNGIPQKVLDKIFQPFFTTKPTGQGTGLGLSLSYDIVKAHGGELKVKSKEGSGSEFIVSIPFI